MTARSRALDELAQAHAAVGGNAPGRRHATQQLNRSYAVLIAAQFQGFCRDFHTECVDHLVNALSPIQMKLMIRAEFTWNRHLDRGNAQPSGIGSDLGRLGIDFWQRVEVLDPRNRARKTDLDKLSHWRNAIVHQDFNPKKLGGRPVLQLVRVQKWRKLCEALARSFDEVMRTYPSDLTGTSPW